MNNPGMKTTFFPSEGFIQSDIRRSIVALSGINSFIKGGSPEQICHVPRLPLGIYIVNKLT
ncbi:hypothetical protein EEL30_23930 [Brevibacillus laterosporus]|uniref:Uncharacterized protein n=1 Tax=Brevibacillus laterosporus TaxID=1465 RepID=A0A518VDL1_BRELA|nr:hypothetical protein EEL30_23930 [Brevibacillus laterosporus]